MDNAEQIERQALRELLQLLRDLNRKEQRDEHDHIDNRCNPGQLETAR